MLQRYQRAPGQPLAILLLHPADELQHSHGFCIAYAEARRIVETKQLEQIAHLHNTGQRNRIKVKQDEAAYKGQEGKTNAILTIVRTNKGMGEQALSVSWRPGPGCVFQ